MLVTLYVASEYAGAIPAILVNTPGIPAAAITALDGYPMRLRGEAGAALTLSILSAGFGSIISTLLLIVTSTTLASVALAFGPAEYFAVAVLGLSLVSSLSGHSMLKGFVALFFGLAVGLIGTDPIDGVTRYAFSESLLSGVGFLPALIGLFALSSIFSMIEDFVPTTRAARQAAQCLRPVRTDEAAFLDATAQHAHRLPRQRGARPWRDHFGGGGLRFSEKDIEAPRDFRHWQSGRRGGIGNRRQCLGGRSACPDAGARHSGLGEHGGLDRRADVARCPTRTAAVRKKSGDLPTRFSSP